MGFVLLSQHGLCRIYAHIVANRILSRIRAFLGLFCPDFYSDIRDFTQILCRYLPKKLAAGTSGRDIDHLEEAEDVDQPGDAQAKEHLPGSFQSAFFLF